MCHLLRRSTCMSSCPSFPLSLLGLSFLFIQIRQVSNMIMRSSGPLKSGAWGIWSFIRVTGNTSIGVLLETTRWRRITFRGSINCLWRRWDGIFGYLTSHEAYCLCVGNHSGHNLHTRGWGDMRWRASPTGIRTRYHPVNGGTMLPTELKMLAITVKTSSVLDQAMADIGIEPIIQPYNRQCCTLPSSWLSALKVMYVRISYTYHPTYMIYIQIMHNLQCFKKKNGW